MDEALAAFLKEIKDRDTNRRREKAKTLGLPEDTPSEVIKQEEMRREIITRYNLDLKSTWQEIWNFMKKSEELGALKEASEMWANMISGITLNTRR